MSDDFDKDLLKFLTSSYRSAVAHREDYGKDMKQIEERLYGIVRDEDWEKLSRLVQEKENELEVELSEIRDFLETVEDDSILKTNEPENVASDIKESTERALKTKLKMLDGQEVVATTDEAISVDAIFDMQQEAYEEYDKKLFLISAQGTWDGRISVELSANKQKFEVMKVYKDSNDELHYQHFGQAAPNKGFNVEATHTEEFFVYKFVEDHTQYLLFSQEKLNPMRCRITGTHFKLNDRTEVGEKRTLPTNQDMIFVKDVEPAITKISDEEMQVYKDEVDHDWIADHLLGNFRHPKWFERLLMAIVFTNDDNGFPSHFFWLGDTGTGKSVVLDCLDRALDEPGGTHTGTGSTVKGLVPSFKDQPPNEGHLLEAQRVALIDEMVNLLSNSTQNGNNNMQDTFRALLDLLEHSSRTFSSGNGSVRGLMQGCMFAVGNPAYGINNMMQAVEKLDQAFMSRCILYDQTQSHIDYIENNKSEVKSGNEEDMYPEFDEDFVSLADTLREEIRIESDYDRVTELKEELKALVPATFSEVYRSRYDHHIQNVVEGLAKANTLIEGREEFEVREEDWRQAKNIFEILIGSWADSVNLKEMSLPSRPHYLPDAERRIYEQVRDQPGITTKEIETDASSVSMKLSKLSRLDIVQQIEGKYYPYWHDRVSETSSKVEGLT